MSTKKRRTKRMPGYPGIYKIEVLNESNRWIEPTRGAKYGVKASHTSGGTRKELRKHFLTFQDAKAFWMRTQSQDLFTRHEVEQMTFGALAQRWMDTALPHKKLSTQARYRSYLKHYKPLWDLPVEKINVTHIDALITQWKMPDYLKKSNPTRCEYSHEFSLLRSIFHFYIERFNRSYALPFIRSHSKDICVRTKAKVRKDLTPEQYQLFLKELKVVCGHKWEPVYYLAQFQYWMYSRVQEAAAIHFEDFNFETNRVCINKRAVWARTKGTTSHIDAGLKASDVKENPISPMLTSLYREWTLKSGRRKGLMFTLKGELIPYRIIEHKYSMALKNAGLPFSGTHILRHASLTDLYAHTNDILVVRDLAGHTDVKTTQQYASVRQGAKDKAVQQHCEFHANLGSGTQRDANQ